MSDLTIIPSVEQINLEYRLAQNKASEAVQHAINCGLMLLQVKASLAHGQWLPWLEDQRKSGSLEFSQPTASKYMKIASNYNRGFNLTESPSIRAALELLTEDKPASEPQPDLELETAQERKAREAAEAKAKAAEARASQAEQRGEEWRQQSITEKKKREEAERAAALKASELRILQQSVDAAAEFSEWITSLDNESLWEAERAFQVALNNTADYRLARATVDNYRISDAALSHTFGGGKSAGLRGV